MRLFTADFAELEEAFINSVGVNSTPLDKTLVLLPSQRLQNSLRKTLADRKGCISGITFNSFSALCANINTSVSTDSKPLLPAGLLQDFIVKNILKNSHLSSYTRGYCRIMKSAFRDLIAAEITPEDLKTLLTADDQPEENILPLFEKQETTEEAPFLTKEQKEDLAHFINYYQVYLNKIKKEGFYTYGDFFHKAAQNTAQSDYLKSFKKIIFYGFYDMTALQYNIFKEICLNFNCEVYFPYMEGPAYGFSKSFYEAYIYPLAKEVLPLTKEQSALSKLAQNIFEPSTLKTDTADIRIISVSGVYAEVQAAAKEILLFKEKYQIPFNKIALFARSMQPYKYDIPNVFEQNKIPINYSFDFPLFNHPLAAFIYNLLGLGRNDFYNADVKAVVTSPYFKGSQNIWRAIIKNSGITGGLAQWEGLRALNTNINNEVKRKEYINSVQELTNTIKDLAKACAQIEKSAPFQDLAQNTEDFINTYIKEELCESEQNILDSVRSIIRQVSAFGQIKETADDGEFLEELLSAIKEATYNKTQSLNNAVEADDIMALRGHQFEAAVFLGMNEGILPASPSADPALREEYRQLLQKIGFLLHTRNDRYFEEKLLFAMALSSVKRKCSFIFQRSGDDGKDKIISLYLNRLIYSAGKDIKKPDLQLSRREGERLKQWPLEFLTQKEAATYAALNFPKHSNILELAFNPEGLPEKSAQALILNAGQLSYSAPGLTQYDGIIKQDNILHENITDRGLSPSSMQKLWACPAAYLFTKIINEKDPLVFNRTAMQANQKGTLSHQILESFYKRLLENNIFDHIFPEGASTLFEHLSDSYFPEDKYKEYGLYPIVWKAASNKTKEDLKNLITEDILYMKKLSLKPAFFEHHVEAEVPFGQNKLKLHGNIDRIDLVPPSSSQDRPCRIVDYKSSKKEGSSARIIFEKGFLQQPLYMLMLNFSNKEEERHLTPFEADLLSIDQDGSSLKVFTASDYNELQPYFEKAINLRLDLAKNGTFFITPNDNACKYCSYGDICRKNHTPSLMRARYTPKAKELINLAQIALNLSDTKKNDSKDNKPNKRKTNAEK